jgi:hypothetical protein
VTIRPTRQSVTFRHPFSISGAEGVQPAGTYIVETNEELLEGLSFPAYHRVSTSIILSVWGGGSGSRLCKNAVLPDSRSIPSPLLA